jgi:hypothetical protein
MVVRGRAYNRLHRRMPALGPGCVKTHTDKTFRALLRPPGRVRLAGVAQC